MYVVDIDKWREQARQIPWPKDYDALLEEVVWHFVAGRTIREDFGRYELRARQLEHCLFQAHRVYKAILGTSPSLSPPDESEFMKMTLLCLQKLEAMGYARS